ncbi:ricin-type beta-trefoil lectin domain protein [Streptomyces sp. NRRL B-24484]|uniref:ricin-type beta-trefoil lectin domain protein n=1 Tax=Streptomyces sp. NRRL B-24484 TaxID=1463833 RepID=UPI0004BFC5C5|nr:ricin-type beta-trefoil lectin domain protein [Streptomyces sp. NRRL B-24484]
MTMPRRLWAAATAALATATSLMLPLAPAHADPTATSPNGNGLAVTPPMGFNNWARFGCSTGNPYPGDTGPSESLILAQADALVSRGLAAKGYTTVTIDDCWMAGSRDASGNLVANASTFPHGMVWLGQQLHSKGLKFGIYEDIGSHTCGGYPGSWNHFQQDVDLFASWAVDYIKLDGCNMPAASNSAAGYTTAYHAFGAAMKNNASRRDMVYSESSPAYFFIGSTDLSDWYTVIDAASKDGQLWREGYDVQMFHQGGSAWNSVLTQYGYNWPLSRYAAPGSWNDPDFLVTGDNLTDDESRSQIALWSMMAAPLILSTDITALSPASLAALSNSDIIAVDQDGLGKQAGLVAQNGSTDILAKQLANGDRAVAVLNRGSAATTVSTSLAAVGFTGSCTATVKNLWTGATSTTTGTVSATVPAHGTAIVRIAAGGCGRQPTGEVAGIGGKCLDDSGSLTGDGNPAILYHCTGNANQRWTLPGDGTVRILGACLDAVYRTNDSRYTGYWAAIGTCDGRATEKWTYRRNGNLSNDGLPGLCLDDYAALTDDVNPVIVYPCAGAGRNEANQIWALPS